MKNTVILFFLCLVKLSYAQTNDLDDASALLQLFKGSEFYETVNPDEYFATKAGDRYNKGSHIAALDSCVVLPDDRFAIALGKQFYTHKGVDYCLFIAGLTEAYDCHTCGFQLTGALFKRTNDTWNIVYKDVDSRTNMGEWHQKVVVLFDKMGKDQWAILTIYNQMDGTTNSNNKVKVFTFLSKVLTDVTPIHPKGRCICNSRSATIPADNYDAQFQFQHEESEIFPILVEWQGDTLESYAYEWNGARYAPKSTTTLLQNTANEVVDAPLPTIYETLLTEYTVKAGETLYAVARANGIKVQDIKDWNNLASDNLLVGQKLRLQASALSGEIIEDGIVATETSPIFHTVAAGENLYRISIKYNVKIEQLKRINHLKSDAVQKGQKLRIE